MPDAARLSRNIFAQPTLRAARDLLGTRLVRMQDGQRIGGTIVETEAYIGQEDQGCHARAGLTPRTQVMFGPPGHAYVYFTYGMHWMLNFVTEAQDTPAAVLVRAIVPLEGLDLIAVRRKGRPFRRWTDGPAKICQALAIDGDFNGVDLCAEDSPIFVEHGDPVLDSNVTTGPRVGLNNVPEPWKSSPWRFLVNLTAKATEITERV
jgi:DNA-3-methyladenine glycosylase